MKILVFGGGGMLGHVVVKYLLSKNHNVTFTVREKVPSWMPLPKTVGILKFNATGKIPDLTGYDWIVNCIGNIKQKSGLESVDFYQINSIFPWKLALACKKAGAKMIHVSSDCVFSGKKPAPESYGPMDKLDAEDDYGISKALGECSDAVVIRTSIIGPSEASYGLFEWFRGCRPGALISGYTNHHWSGVTTLFLAQFIEKMMTEPDLPIPEEGGLIQLASEPIAKAVLLKLINDVFELGQVITETPATLAINRALTPSVKMASDIHSQLVELRNWMAVNDE